MSQPYVGALALVGFNFAPVGWQICDGSLLSIAENLTLYQLIGTTYGGDGQNTFAVPDLRGRVPIHQGQLPGGGNYGIGQLAGVEQVTLTQQQMPGHTHTLLCSANPQNSSAPGGAYLAATAGNKYSSGTPAAAMASTMVGNDGGGQPHDNRQPYLTLNWIISLYGIFPSQG